MVRTQSFLIDSDGTFVEWLGLVVLALWDAVSVICELNNAPGTSTTGLGC